MAGWGRISQILSMKNNLNVIEATKKENDSYVLEFQNVSFSYTQDKEILKNVSFCLEKGKTYAMVGPTGGGKTTTASLIARLYDPTSGKILFNGYDIRSLSPSNRVAKIGFILQDPFLFSGTVRDNILHGNECFKNLSKDELLKELNEVHLGDLLKRFDDGLDTVINSSNDGLSIGQKQIIAFMRAIIRRPDLLILDEATANIDTVTEQLLEEILNQLPKSTMKIIIAHRLVTIENADEIFFVNGGSVAKAGSLRDAVKLLMNGKRAS